MNNMQKICKRNGITLKSRRYNLSELISESYRILYECESDSKLYKLAESHINNIKKDPRNLESLSRDLSALKSIHSLGESAIIKESDIPADTQDFTDEMDLDTENLDKDRDVEEMDDRDVINEEEDLEVLDDEDVINEDADMEELEDKDVINEEEEIGTEELPEESEEEPITPEELQELKKHLREMRKARKMKESKKVSRPKKVNECRTWSTERSSMTAALKHFREASVNKAFYKTFSKTNTRLKSDKPLTLQESILLYKASNSAMTQLTVELEHNPEFIYTFKECTNILANDTESLLESIKNHRAPKKSLMKSLLEFSNILLESEEDPDFEDDYEEDEDIVVENEEGVEDEPKEEETLSEEEEEDVTENEEDTPAEAEEESLTEEDEESEEVLPESEDEEETLEEEDNDPMTDEEIEESEDSEELEEDEEEIPAEEIEEDDDSEITDEEAEELKKKLVELRRNRK